MPMCDLPSYRRQQLLIEYASLKHVRLRGIYVSLTSGDTTNWSGVLFVRKGPYAPAIFRFRIQFPQSFPDDPPLITFNTTDIFHPLVTPPVLAGQANVSSVDSRHHGGVTLPPSALSLKHGFPDWYHHRSRKVGKREATGDQRHDTRSGESSVEETSLPSGDGTEDQITVAEVLLYVRRCFEEESVLDSIPFEAAAHENAWYAWRDHRIRLGKIQRETVASDQDVSDADADVNRREDHQNQSERRGASPGGPSMTTAPPHTPNTPATTNVSSKRKSTEVRAKAPKDWNWEGVWEERIRKAVESSLTDTSIYGSASTKDDDIHFSNEVVDTVDGMLVSSQQPGHVQV